MTPSNLMIWLTSKREIDNTHEEVKGQIWHHYDDFGALIAIEVQYPNEVELDDSEYNLVNYLMESQH